MIADVFDLRSSSLEESDDSSSSSCSSSLSLLAFGTFDTVSRNWTNASSQDKNQYSSKVCFDFRTFLRDVPERLTSLYFLRRLLNLSTRRARTIDFVILFTSLVESFFSNFRINVSLPSNLQAHTPGPLCSTHFLLLLHPYVNFSLYRILLSKQLAKFLIF